MTKQPKHKQKIDNIEVAVWENNSENGPYLTLSMSRSYKTKEDEWKTTQTFTVNDIPKLEKALAKVYDYAKMEWKADQQ